jgi:hypothetical protein
MYHPHPKHHPSRRPGHPISCILQHPRRETTRRVHRPRASSTPYASAPPLAVLPLHEHEHVSTSTVVYGKSRVVQVAAAERCVQLTLDGGFGKAHTNPLPVVHVPAVLCVCTVSQGAQLRAAGRLVAIHQCSARLSWTVGVAAKLTLHVGGPPTTLHVGPQPHRRYPPHPLSNPPSTAPSAVRGGSLQ